MAPPVPGHGMDAAWVWLLWSEDGGGILRPWRHLPLRGPAPGRGWQLAGTGTMWHGPGPDRDDVASSRLWHRRPGPALAAGNSLRKNHDDVIVVVLTTTMSHSRGWPEVL